MSLSDGPGAPTRGAPDRNANVIHIAQRHGLWQIERDGQRFGHYPNRTRGLTEADDAARLPHQGPLPAWALAAANLQP